MLARSSGAPTRLMPIATDNALALSEWPVDGDLSATLDRTSTEAQSVAQSVNIWRNVSDKAHGLTLDYDNHRDMVLHLVCRRGNRDVMRFRLMEAGALIGLTAVDVTGSTKCDGCITTRAAERIMLEAGERRSEARALAGSLRLECLCEEWEAEA